MRLVYVGKTGYMKHGDIRLTSGQEVDFGSEWNAEKALEKYPSLFKLVEEPKDETQPSEGEEE